MRLYKQDQELIKRLLNKDRQAAREFYLMYAQRLIKYVKTKIQDQNDAEEIVQDVLYIFLDNLDNFNGNSSINTYLYSVASNKIIDFYRKKKIKKILFSQLSPIVNVLTDEKHNPEQILDKTYLKQKIKSTLDKMTPRYAKILWLKYVEGRSVAEIAQILKITFSAAESLLLRARRMFILVFTTK
jgi:RNA polymerase sigma-70 factor, ECF subfamily